MLQLHPCFSGNLRGLPWSTSLLFCRCLVGDLSGRSYGDVAFLEHHNLLTNILGEVLKTPHMLCMQWYKLTDIVPIFFLNPGLNSSGWAEGWTQSDFELLCVDGHRAALSEWESCNLGAIPPNSIMTRPVLTSRVYDFLMKSQVSSFVFIKSHSYQMGGLNSSGTSSETRETSN